MTEERIQAVLREVDEESHLSDSRHRTSDDNNAPFWHFMQRELDDAYTFALQLTGNERQASEIIHDVFVSAHDLYAALRNKRGLRPWIRRRIRQRVKQAKLSPFSRIYQFIHTWMSHRKQTCQEHSRKSLLEYANGELTPAEQDEVESHLTQCAVCRAAYQELQQTVTHVTAVLKPIEAPAALRQRIQATIAARKQRSRRSFAPVLKLVSVTAFLLVVCISGVAYFNFFQQLHRAEQHTREMTQSSAESKIRQIRGLPDETSLFDGQDVIILTGELASEDMSPETTYDALTDKIADPRRTRFVVTSGSFESVRHELDERLETSRGRIVEERIEYTDQFVAAILSVQLPDLAAPVRIILLRSAQRRPNNTGEDTGGG